MHASSGSAMRTGPREQLPNGTCHSKLCSSPPRALRPADGQSIREELSTRCSSDQSCVQLPTIAPFHEPLRCTNSIHSCCLPVEMAHNIYNIKTSELHLSLQPHFLGISLSPKAKDSALPSALPGPHQIPLSSLDVTWTPNESLLTPSSCKGCSQRSLPSLSKGPTCCLLLRTSVQVVKPAPGSSEISWTWKRP